MKLRMIWLVFVLTFLCSTAAAKGTVEAKIGETEYQTLQDAINAAETGSIIVLQKDVSPASLTITGKNITISGNWKNITGSGTTEISGGAKVVFDHVSILSGTVSASGTSSVEMKDSRISAQVLVYNSTLKTSGTSYTNVSGTVIVAENGSSLTINDCTFRANTGTNGGALYLKGSTATLNGNTMISGNRAIVGGGIYVDEGAALRVNSGKIFDNTADTAAADVFVAANASQVSLPSVTAWNRPIHRGSRFSLDGWYEDAAENRWSLTNARQGSGNLYVGDTVAMPGHSLKAGFTAYDVLNVEIEWVDYNNRYGTRMETVEFTARDNAGNLLKYQTLDGSEGETASLTLSEANGWKGTISPLLPGLSFDLHLDNVTFVLTSGGNVIRTYVVDHNKPFLYVKVDRWPDEPAEKNQGPSAVSTVYLKNTYKIPVNFVKVWDDSNNKDGVRPKGLRLYLKYNNEDLTTFDDINMSDHVHPPISLTADNDWKRTVYLLADDEKEYYANIIPTEDCPDSYVNTGHSATSNSDGSIDITFINHHDLRVDPDAPEPVSEDKINYRIDLKWTWNGNGNGELPHPKVTVLLRGDGKEMRRAEIAADAAQEITFSDLPKYRDIEKSALVNYTIQEIITDENWVRFPVTEARVGEIPAIVDYWYSLDGMGRYRVEYAQAEIKEDTAASSTVNGEITNRYERLQNTTKVVITKRWKDHQNENKVRPGSIMFGLFRSADDTDPAWTRTLSGGSTDGWWRGTIENLPIYDDSGQAIDYSAYIVKESYDNGTTWLKSGAEYAITAGEKTYTYNYSVVTQR